MHEDISTDSTANSDDPIDRRRYPRSKFAYPVEFKIFSRNSEHTSFKGNLKDISINGAYLQFEDKYGRCNMQDMNNARLKISFTLPHEDKTNIFATIRWIKRINPGSFNIKMRIEFKDMEGWQLDIIERLIGMKNKDHHMIWNLWGQYEKK